jgi:outer membrane lipoprotein-sorting protein
MRLLYLTFISLCALDAQSFPDGSALLKQSTEARMAYPSYELTQVTTTEPASMTMSMHMQFVKSGKFRMEMTMMGMGFTMVSDGTDSWMSMPAMKKYMKLPKEGDLDVSAFASMLAVDAKPADTRLLRAEAIETDGESHDCWVVETHATDSTSVYWIDKARGFQLQVERSMKVPGVASAVKSKTVTHSIKLSPLLSDSLFVFTPPADATETDELFPGMNAMMGKQAPAAPTHSLTAPAPIEPEAFAPTLVPVHRTQPVYPETAGGVQGTVELLLTIDPMGNVVNAEPLTGPLGLRAAAIDTVRQWQFRPVLRGERPVFAATQSSVMFLHGPTRPDFKFDPEESMASSKRMIELMTKYPRSPQQVLADLEQDRGGDGRRNSALAELARVALAAENFEKADAYANEALQMRRNDGDAVHDGNMVLGMIAIHQGNVQQAKYYLIESGKSKGSPVLGSFGPKMILAKALLDKGEYDTVLQYLVDCREFWTMGVQRIDDWMATIKAGRAPAFDNLY